MLIKTFIRRNIYRWHRITSLIVAIPVLLWTISGFLHPVMSSFRPNVKNQSLPTVVIDTSKIRLSLSEVLEKHQIDSLHNFRIVELYGAFYYQVQHTREDSLTYISCYNAQLLTNGDEQYAAYLAQRYLSEPTADGQKKEHHNARADLSSIVSQPVSMSPHERTNVTDVTLVKSFTGEYKKSNILLPVYRVEFDRKDHLRLYIETSTGRLSTAVDDTRAWFTRFFSLTHSWSFLNGMGIFKNLLLGTVSMLCFLTSLFGFIVYNITNKKKRNHAVPTSRSWHRLLGNIFVLTTLLYAISGAWHSFHKIGETNEAAFYDKSVFHRKETRFPLDTLLEKLDTAKLANISLIKMEDIPYWQVTQIKGKWVQKRYFKTSTLEELPDGDNTYGCYLACQFANKKPSSITHNSRLTSFNNQYSMMKKRLPVIEVGFNGGKNYYVETSTGRLSAISGSLDKAERFSFSNLHMHHYWEDWFGRKRGKSIKNLVLISSTLGLLLLAVTGMLMYRSKQLKKRAREQTAGA